MPGFYITNIPLYLRQEGGSWTFNFPGPENESKFPLFDAADTGMFIKGIVLNKEKLLGGNVRAAAEYITAAQMLATFIKTYPEAGASARFQEVPRDKFVAGMTGRGMPEFAAVELYENMQLLSVAGYYGGAELSLDILDKDDKPTTFDEYIKVAPAFKDLK
jgi:hypothetical protein